MRVKVKGPQQDPTILAAQKAEQARADAAFVSNTQGLLNDDAKARARRYGRRTDMTGAPGAPSAGVPATLGGGLAGVGGGTLGAYSP
jgi:hypothetical protein